MPSSSLRSSSTVLIRFSVIIRRISAFRTGSAQALAVTWTPFVFGYSTGTAMAITAGCRPRPSRRSRRVRPVGREDERDLRPVISTSAPGDATAAPPDRADEGERLVERHGLVRRREAQGRRGPVDGEAPGRGDPAERAAVRGDGLGRTSRRRAWGDGRGALEPSLTTLAGDGRSGAPRWSRDPALGGHGDVLAGPARSATPPRRRSARRCWARPTRAATPARPARPPQRRGPPRPAVAAAGAAAGAASSAIGAVGFRRARPAGAERPAGRASQ